MDVTLAQLVRDITLLSAECEARGRRIEELEAEVARLTAAAEPPERVRAIKAQ